MTDEYGQRTRIWFAGMALAFCGAVIVWLVLYGQSENSLHASALSWAFTVSIGVLAAVGFSAIVGIVPLYLAARK